MTDHANDVTIHGYPPIHSPSLSERERSLILVHAERELAYALELKARGNYEDAAAALRKVAQRYEDLAGDGS